MRHWQTVKRYNKEFSTRLCSTYIHKELKRGKKKHLPLINIALEIFFVDALYKSMYRKYVHQWSYKVLANTIKTRYI